MSAWLRLGEIIAARGLVAQERIDQLAALPSGGLIGDRLVAAGEISRAQLAEVLSVQTGLPCETAVDIDTTDPDLLDLIPISYARENRIFPLRRDEGSLILGVADPFDTEPVGDLATLTRLQIRPLILPEDEVVRLINQGYERKAGETSGIVDQMDPSGAELSDDLAPADLLDTSDEAPIIRFVNSMITRAFKERASDIHVEPYETELVVRYRIDGILYEIARPPHKAHASIVSRVKILANLDIAEKRLPQDGRFRVRIAGKDLDLRVSTLPTAFGERLVLRLLDQSSKVLKLEEIGMDAEMLTDVNRMINKSHGVFLVTGPTGAGKTTTLYAAITRLNAREKNIVTVEDPIEYQLTGVGQMQVNSRIDLTFASGLRSILRQDPDVIMVGEIRDAETAEIAIQAALTGHLVFSTLHTNDASGAMTRLVEMGIEPFLAASAVVGVLAQRLVRRVCSSCRVEVTPEPAILKELGVTPKEGERFYRGRGCPACMDIGYRGRTAIYELLPVDGKVRELVLQNRDSGTIKEAAVAAGMRSLRANGLALARRGETTLEEVLRVTQEDQ